MNIEFIKPEDVKVFVNWTDPEGEEFALWLELKGYNVEFAESNGTDNDNITFNQLWSEYCAE